MSGVGVVHESLPVSPSRSAALALVVGASEAKRAESWGVGTAVSSGVAFYIHDSRVKRSTIKESHAPGTSPRLWDKSIRAQPLLAPGEGSPGPPLLPPEQRRGGQAWGSGSGWCRGVRLTSCKEQDSPGHRFASVWPDWLRPVWPTAHHNCSCETRAGKGEAGLILAQCFLTGRKLHTGSDTERGSLLFPLLPLVPIRTWHLSAPWWPWVCRLEGQMKWSWCVYFPTPERPPGHEEGQGLWAVWEPCAQDIHHSQR